MFNVTGSAADVHFVCLLYLHTFLRVRGQEGEYMHAVLCCCSCPLCACKCCMSGRVETGVRMSVIVCVCVGVWVAGANLNIVKRIVTLHLNQTNHIDITIHLKESKYSNEP